MNTYLKTYNPANVRIYCDGELMNGLSDNVNMTFDEPLTYFSAEFFITREPHPEVDKEYNLGVTHTDGFFNVNGKLKLKRKVYVPPYYVTYYFEKESK
jgi:hypothetical protein